MDYSSHSPVRQNRINTDYYKLPVLETGNESLRGMAAVDSDISRFEDPGMSQ